MAERGSSSGLCLPNSRVPTPSLNFSRFRVSSHPTQRVSQFCSQITPFCPAPVSCEPPVAESRHKAPLSSPVLDSLGQVNVDFEPLPAPRGGAVETALESCSLLAQLKLKRREVTVGALQSRPLLALQLSKLGVETIQVCSSVEKVESLEAVGVGSHRLCSDLAPASR